MYSADGDWVLMPEQKEYWNDLYKFVEKEVIKEIIELIKLGYRKPDLTHSSGSAALPGIAKHKAILSAAETQARGEQIRTGEFTSSNTKIASPTPAIKSQPARPGNRASRAFPDSSARILFSPRRNSPNAMPRPCARRRVASWPPGSEGPRKRIRMSASGSAITMVPGGAAPGNGPTAFNTKIAVTYAGIQSSTNLLEMLRRCYSLRSAQIRENGGAK